MPYTHQWSASYERKLPWSSQPARDLQREPRHRDAAVLAGQPAALAARRPGHRRQPSKQRAGGGLSGPARQGDRPRRRRRPLCRHRFCPASRSTPPARWRCRSPTTRSAPRVPRTNERRPDPRYTSNLVISNDAESWYDGLQIEWAKRLSQGSDVHDQLYAQQGRPTRRRKRRSSAPATRISWVRTRVYAKGYSRFHTPHRFTFNGSYLLPFWQNRAGPGRDAPRRMAGIGVDPAGVRHAVHREPDRARSELRRVRRGAARRARPLGAWPFGGRPGDLDAGDARIGVPRLHDWRHHRSDRRRATRCSATAWTTWISGSTRTSGSRGASRSACGSRSTTSSTRSSTRSRRTDIGSATFGQI